MPLKSSSYLNRELSWLEFNQRVLEEAQDPTQPLLERLKFLTIVSSNLDEFFEIRVAALKQLVETRNDVPGPDELHPNEVLTAIRTRVIRMFGDQYRLLHETLLPSLAEAKIYLRPMQQLDPTRIDWARDMFRRDILPILTPLAVDPSHPFPQLLNKSVNLAVLYSKPSQRETLRHAFVQVPRGIPRLIPLPSEKSDSREFVLLSELVRYFVQEVFPGMNIQGAWPTRITRNSDLYIDEEEAHNLLLTIEEELQKRNRGAAVRLELTEDCPAEIESYLLTHLHLTPEDVYRVPGPVNLTQLFALTEAGRSHPNLHDPLFNPTIPPSLSLTPHDFESIRKNDILLHHPYESFQPIVSILEQAAIDPNVLAIKMTLYRTSGDSTIARHLIKAAELGKQVAVVLELKARFDEARNVSWAKELEYAGVHVTYGLVGLKTHAKCILVVRSESGALRRYVHIGTGNYNSVTARIYEDIGSFTSEPEIGRDATELFNYLTGYAHAPEYQSLLVAPHRLKPRVIELIDKEASFAERGRITMKMNSISDPDVIEALYRASQAGVHVDLIVRGICCLRAGVTGLSENISVRSILGRQLEHSRIYRFEHGLDNDEPLHLIGSADMMERNLKGRVETLVPLTHPKHRMWLDTVLGFLLADDVAHYRLGSHNEWSREGMPGFDRDAQSDLHAWVTRTQVR